LEIKKSNEKGRLNKKEPKKSATPSFPSNPTKPTFSPFKIVSIVKNKGNIVSKKKEI